MREGTSLDRWAELNNVTTVEELLTNPASDKWTICCDYILSCVEVRYSDFPKEVKHDIVQDVYCKARKGLPDFRRDSKLTTWLSTLTRNYIVDWFRHRNGKPVVLNLGDMPEYYDDDIERTVERPSTPDQVFLRKERMERIGKVSKEYFLTLESKKNYERNRQIIYMFIHDQLSNQEIAQKLGISAALVGTVIRPFKDYLRKKYQEEADNDAR